MTPQKGIEIQEFYQVMDDSRYDAMQWIKENTPKTQGLFLTIIMVGVLWVCAAPTISAVDPQYLALSREFNDSHLPGTA
jgi:hypothetical protein